MDSGMRVEHLERVTVAISSIKQANCHGIHTEYAEFAPEESSAIV